MTVQYPDGRHHTRKRTGAAGEQLAVEHLAHAGYRILERNWRCRSGEIDVIAEDGDTLVFIEVRTRRDTGTFGTPQESVNFRKQQQVRQTAVTYLHMNHQDDRKIRFDLVSVLLSADGKEPKLDLLRHAF